MVATVKAPYKRESREERHERRVRLATGQQCFWCWVPTNPLEDVFWHYNKCDFALCPRCRAKEGFMTHGSIKSGMRWFAEDRECNPHKKGKRQQQKDTGHDA